MSEHMGTQRLARKIAVTRHRGAEAWVKARRPDAEFVSHLDPKILFPGDEVIGTLPVNYAADVIGRGASFLHLSLDLPPEARDRELTPEEMDRYGARLEPYNVELVRLLGGWRRTWPFRRGRWRAPTSNAIVLLVAAFLAALNVNLLSQLIWESTFSTTGLPAGRLWLGAVLVVTAILVACVLYGYRHAVLSSRIARTRPAPARSVLIMGLSPLPPACRAEAEWVVDFAEHVPLRLLALPREQIANRKQALIGADPPDPEAETMQAHVGFLEQCGEPDKPFPWQQNLRAIAAQSAQLRALVVLTSRASHGDFPRFEQLVRALLRPIGREVVIRELAVDDFEDYDPLRSAFAQARRLAAQWGARSDDICIDVTAGQKIFSIAGAIATVNSGTVFSYVTNKGEVWFYDASIEIGEAAS